jgi:hypothetical protein
MATTTLNEILLAGGKRARVTDDCVQLIDDEVRSKTGLGGVAVKGAYAVVKKLSPNIIRDAVDKLLDDFVSRLEPFYADFRANGGGSQSGFSDFLVQRKHAVADALLGVTDRRIQNAKNRTIGKAYEKLRPTGEKHVQAAVPGVGRVVERYL